MNNKKHQKNYSISAIASEIQAQFKQQLENKSISAIAPKIIEQYQLEQKKRLDDLRNQLESGLHEQIALMVSDDAHFLQAGEIATAQDSAESYLEKNSLQNAMNESIAFLKAGDLYDAINDKDRIKVAEITRSYHPLFPLLENLLIWASMSQENLITALEESKERMETELDLFHQNNKERTKKAIETRKATSKMHEINAWFLKKEAAKYNLNSPDITSEAAQMFGVTPQYVNKLKSAYLSSKKK